MAAKTVGVEKRLYTTIEAAESLGVCDKTVRDFVKRGLLKPIKRVIRTLLFSAAELDRFVSEQEAE
jgi:excisionase family DNA binding protein